MGNLDWHKSSFCNNDSCLEIAHLGFALRNSSEPDGPVVQVTLAEMAAFVAGAQEGDFDDLVGR